MAKLYLNQASKKVLDSYLSSPAHALSLVGDTGVGLHTIAHNAALRMASKSQTITTISPEKGTIPIERIRNLYTETRSIQQQLRVIIIDDADTMSPPAQNALLKLLEEPVKNVHFILTTHNPTVLLPTIRSRTQELSILPVSAQMSQDVLKDGILSSTQRTQALFLAKGKPAELTRLSTDEKYFESRVAVVTDARSFLQSDMYMRLSIIKNYTDRTQSLELLSMCTELLTFSLLKSKNYAAADTMEYFDEIMQQIQQNGHVKTHLMHLVTKLA